MPDLSRLRSDVGAFADASTGRSSARFFWSHSAFTPLSGCANLPKTSVFSARCIQTTRVGENPPERHLKSELEPAQNLSRMGLR
jgi:hypothetical protein